MTNNVVLNKKVIIIEESSISIDSVYLGLFIRLPNQIATHQLTFKRRSLIDKTGVTHKHFKISIQQTKINNPSFEKQKSQFTYTFYTILYYLIHFQIISRPSTFKLQNSNHHTLTIIDIMASMTTVLPPRQPRLKRLDSNSFLLKDIPPLEQTEMRQIDWDNKPTRDLFQQLIDEFDSRRQSPKSLSPQKQMEIEEPSKTIISIHGCKCSKIGCLKLYCECFTRGELCGPNCICVSCENCVGNQSKVVLAQQMANFRKPGTFVGVEAFVPERKCTCKKSKCQKKYCECYNAGVKCSSHCDCIGCENQEHEHQNHAYRMQVQTPA